MTQIELDKREKALDEREAQLNMHQREVLDRERAVKNAENRNAHQQDSERWDYLFDLINQHKDERKVVVEMPQVIQTRDSDLSVLTAAMVIITAVMSVATFLAVVF